MSLLPVELLSGEVLSASFCLGELMSSELLSGHQLIPTLRKNHLGSLTNQKAYKCKQMSIKR